MYTVAGNRRADFVGCGIVWVGSHVLLASFGPEHVSAQNTSLIEASSMCLISQPVVGIILKDSKEAQCGFFGACRRVQSWLGTCSNPLLAVG